MKNGICYVAFGEQYDYQCACSVSMIRKHSDIPVMVVTNLDVRSDKWKELSNVSFHNVKAESKLNRYYKIRMDLFSPFDVTLFCDTDTAVQSAEFLSGFDEAANYDVMFSVYEKIEHPDKLPMPNLYGKFVKLEEFPLVIFKEGVFFFQKTDATRKLFEQWEYYWRELEMGRDMPALFPATARAKGLNLGVLCPGWDDQNGHIIIHAFGDFKTEGLPTIKKFKPFDG